MNKNDESLDDKEMEDFQKDDEESKRYFQSSEEVR